MSQTQPRFEVVVGVDYSDYSEAALRAAIDVAQRRGGRLHVISVADGYGPPRMPDDLADEARERFREQALATLGTYVGERTEPSSDVLLSVDFGHAHDRILALAHKVRADLIAVGTHGRRGVDRLVVGSVAEAVLREAHCPVLVVR